MGKPRNADTTGAILHVGCRGHNRQRIFLYDMDYIEYLTRLLAALTTTGCQLLSYCLMPNHTHFIVLVRQDGALGDMLRIVGAGYARYFNRRNHRSGALFEGRYWSEHLVSESHLTNTHLYIDANPVIAKLTPQPEDWLWSSAGLHLSSRSDILLCTSIWYDLLGDTPKERQKAYRSLMADYLRIKLLYQSNLAEADLAPRTGGPIVDG